MMDRYGKMMTKSINDNSYSNPETFFVLDRSCYSCKGMSSQTLIDSHKHEAIVKDHSIRNIIPIKLRSFEEEVKAAKGEQIRGKAKITKDIYLPSLDNKILLISLSLLHRIDTTCLTQVTMMNRYYGMNGTTHCSS